MIKEQAQVQKEINRIFQIFASSEGELRPHFVLTGPSGSGKTHTINNICEEHGLTFMEINAAQITKEGLAGNSISKCLTPLLNHGSELVVCLVDEFDKLFISGNSNGQLAHESTNGVQNEFLKILESDHTAVAGDYGKFVNARVDNVLFIFAGAFNNEENITLDRLREFGVKTEFLGRVGLVYNLEPVSLESLKNILATSKTLEAYLELFPDQSKEEVLTCLNAHLEENFEKNSIGVRYLTSLINQYFICDGQLGSKEVKRTSFQKTLKFA